LKPFDLFLFSNNIFLTSTAITKHQQLEAQGKVIIGEQKQIILLLPEKGMFFKT
jgi:hypothetical protein